MNRWVSRIYIKFFSNGFNGNIYVCKTSNGKNVFVETCFIHNVKYIGATIAYIYDENFFDCSGPYPFKNGRRGGALYFKRLQRTITNALCFCNKKKLSFSGFLKNQQCHWKNSTIVCSNEIFWFYFPRMAFMQNLIYMCYTHTYVWVDKLKLRVKGDRNKGN